MKRSSSFAKLDWDVAVLDFSMPGRSGVEGWIKK